jgi:hydrogenase maturation factor
MLVIEEEVFESLSIREIQSAHVLVSVAQVVEIVDQSSAKETLSALASGEDCFISFVIIIN